MQTDVRVGPGIARPLKRVLAGTVFLFLQRGLIVAARRDSRVRAEVAEWPEGVTVRLAIAPKGPGTSVGKRGGRLVPVAATVAPDLLVAFKNVDAAVPALIGMQGVIDCFVEHRATLAGDIGLGISLVRCLHVVEGYLFPDVMTRRILPRPATREFGHIRAYGSVIAALFAPTVKGAAS